MALGSWESEKAIGRYFQGHGGFQSKVRNTVKKRYFGEALTLTSGSECGDGSDWDDSRCGDLGAECKEKVKWNDLDELTQGLLKAKNCAQKCVVGSCKDCSIKSYIQDLLYKGPELERRLLADGNEAAANELSAAMNLANEVINSYSKSSWEQIFNSFSGECITDECSRGVENGAYDAPGTGMLSRLVKARDHLYFRANITQEQDARRANNIIRRQQKLENDILNHIGWQKWEDETSLVGSNWEPRGVFTPDSMQPYYQEISSIIKEIQNAWICNDTREMLQANNIKIGENIKKATKTANALGKNLGEAIDTANDALKSIKKSIKEGNTLAKCIWINKDSKWEQLKCFFKGDAVYFSLVIGIVITILLLFLLRPYVSMLSAIIK